MTHTAKPTDIMLNTVHKVCEEHHIDPMLLRGIITVESAWDPRALRYEQKYHDICLAAGFARKFDISEKSEITLQKFSYGLCQVMGGLARSLGYDGHLLDLLDIETNLKYGCLYLQVLQKHYKTDVDKIISAYNAGHATPSNLTYVNKVKRAMA